MVDKSIETGLELPDVCCGRCEWGKVVNNSAGRLDFSVRECHGGIPQVQFFLIPVRGKTDPGVLEHTGFPKTAPTDSCRHFELKKELQS